jgi:hypothetical protein
MGASGQTKKLRIQMRSLAEQISRDGFAVIQGIVEPHDSSAIARRVDEMLTGNAGTRRMLDLPWCQTMARQLLDSKSLREVRPQDAETVQCTLFTKSTEKNWLVSLHQDLSIPVAERVECDGCFGWSEKEGEVFVQPPTEVLQDILAVRIHLDGCDERNGALRVVPGSHRLGRLSASDAMRVRAATGEVSVPVQQGGAMLMRPLLLHASSKSSVASPRRVLHFVFGPGSLPYPLRWLSRKRTVPGDR